MLHLSAYLLISAACCVASQPPHEYRLVTSLLHNYDVNARPVSNTSQPVDVVIDIVLRQILDLDERDQILVTNIWLRLYWRDVSLTWIPDQHGGIESISLNTDRMWHPDITLYNKVNYEFTDDLKLYPCQIDYDGNVTWLRPMVYRSSCLLDITYFPYDNQTCRLVFGSWTQSGRRLALRVLSGSADLSQYVEHGEFTLSGAPAETVIKYYPTSPEPYPLVYYHFKLTRKPLYYEVNLLIPSSFITALAGVAFLAPPGGGEKISLEITVMLASTVFMLVVADLTPIQSDTIPILGRYYLWIVILLALSTGLTVNVVCLHQRGMLGIEVPQWLRTLVLHWLATVLCMRGQIYAVLKRYGNGLEEDRNDSTINFDEKAVADATTSSPKLLNYRAGSDGTEVYLTSVKPTRTSSLSPPTEDRLDQVLCLLKFYQRHLENKTREDKNKLEWVFIARVLDRLFLCLFIISFIPLILYVSLTRPAS